MNTPRFHPTHRSTAESQRNALRPGFESPRCLSRRGPLALPDQRRGRSREPGHSSAFRTWHLKGQRQRRLVQWTEHQSLILAERVRIPYRPTLSVEKPAPWDERRKPLVRSVPDEGRRTNDRPVAADSLLSRLDAAMKPRRAAREDALQSVDAACAGSGKRVAATDGRRDHRWVIAEAEVNASRRPERHSLKRSPRPHA